MSLLNHLLTQMAELGPDELFIILRKCEEMLASSGIELAQRPKYPKAHPSVKAVKKKKGPRVRFRYRYFKCGKPRCAVCASGGRHGPYKIKIVKDPKTGKEKEIYLGSIHGKRRVKERR